MLPKPFYRATANWTTSDHRGRRLTRSATGISHQSEQDAKRIAQTDAKRFAEEAAAGKPGRGNYAYGDHLLVEPVLQRFGIPGTPGSAFVSVNGYGSEVLNAEQLLA